MPDVVSILLALLTGAIVLMSVAIFFVSIAIVLDAIRTLRKEKTRA